MDSFLFNIEAASTTLSLYTEWISMTKELKFNRLIVNSWMSDLNGYYKIHKPNWFDLTHAR